MAEVMDQSTESSSQANEQTMPPLTYSERHWLHVKKMSARNRTRARNARLIKVLTPKNSVMLLNELLKEDGEDNASFQVEPSEYSPFCATLTTKEFSIKGYGESKNEAKKSAAEKALKAIYLERLKKLNKYEAEWLVKNEQRQKEKEQRLKEEGLRQKERSDTDDVGMDSAEAQPDGTSESQEPEDEDKDKVTLPMVQLASLALYKLFTSWEKAGFEVPNFRAAADSKSQGAIARKEKAKARKPLKRRQLPLNAVRLHPGFLLYYMIPGIEYKDLAIEGTKTQQVFVVSVEAQGKVFIGRAHSKKEARRLAAAAACEDLYQIKCDEKASSNQPMCADDDVVAAPSKKAKLPQQNEFTNN